MARQDRRNEPLVCEAPDKGIEAGRIARAWLSGGWKRYRTAPLPLIDIARTIEPALRKHKDPILDYLSRLGIDARHVRHRFTTDSNEFVIIAAEPQVTATLQELGFGGKAEDFAVIGGLSFHSLFMRGGIVRALCAVSEGNLGAMPDFTEDYIMNGLPAATYETMALAALSGKRGIFDSIASTISESELMPLSELEWLHKDLKEKGSDEAARAFLSHAVLMTGLMDYASRKGNDFGAEMFESATIHEAVHGAIYKANYERRKLCIGRLYDEVMAYTSEVAYSRNPWIALMKMMHGGRETYIGLILDEKTATATPPDKSMEGAFGVLFYEAFCRILDGCGQGRMIDIIGTAEPQLRKAAKDSLDLLSSHFFGTNFDKILSPQEIECIRTNVSEYMERIKGERR